MFLPNAFTIKSSLVKDNDSRCANAWRASLTRDSWVQAFLGERNILCYKDRSYCHYQPSGRWETGWEGSNESSADAVYCESNQRTFVYRKGTWSPESYHNDLLLFCLKVWLVFFVVWGFFNLALVLGCHLNTLSEIHSVPVTCLSLVFTNLPPLEMNSHDPRKY